MRILLCAFLLTRVTIAQPGSTLVVRTINPEGGFISGAIVSLLPSGFEGRTDETGYLSFRELPAGTYRVNVSAPGYVLSDSTIRLGMSEEIRVVIPLENVQHTLPAVEVVTSQPGTDLKSFSRSDITSSNAKNLADFLQNVAGLEVRSDGLPGGKRTLRIGGAAANQVLLLVDGRRIADAGNDEADFSSIPVDWIESIDVYRGSRPELGGQGIGGIVSVTTISAQRGRQVAVAHESSETIHTTSFAGSANIGSVGTVLRFSRTQGPGNYRYRIVEDDGVGTFTPNLGAEYRRSNCDIVRDQVLVKLETGRHQNEVHVTGTLDRADRGMPGLLSPHLTPEARQSSFQQSVNMLVRHSATRMALELRFGAQHDARQYDDPSPYSWIKHSEERSTRWDSQISLNSRIRSVTMATGAVFGKEILQSTRIAGGETQRDSWSLWSRVQNPLASIPALRLSSSISPAVRLEQVGKARVLVPRFALEWNLQTSLNARGIFAWSRSFRTPDLYALFWQDDQLARGNPDLRAESSREWTGRLMTQYRELEGFRLEIEGSLQDVSDLIEWRRAPDGLWKPQNRRQAKVATLDMILSQTVLHGALSSQLGMNWTEARDGSDDRNTGGRYLTFRAPRSWRSTLTFRHRGLALSVTYRWVYRRPITDTNSKWLREYALSDIGVSYFVGWGRLSVEPSLAVNNLFDTQYRVVRFAPMPGREIRIGVKISEVSS